MDQALQQASGCVLGHHYPAPIVAEAAALKTAKEAMYGLRKTQDSRQEADRIQSKHGSRKSGLPQSGLGAKGRPPKGGARTRAREADPRQQDLFGQAALE
jgi:deoxyribodipyrimidine photo-lyase